VLNGSTITKEMKGYKLFIDESGTSNLFNFDINAPVFCLGGCRVHHNNREFIKTRSNQIKYKFWGQRSNGINFRADDLKRKGGDFSIFKSLPDNEVGYTQCKNELKELIRKADYKMDICGVNKTELIINNPALKHAIEQVKLIEDPRLRKQSKWFNLIKGEENNVIESCTKKILINYYNHLVRQDAKGGIIIEASTMNQDTIMYRTYNNLMMNGDINLGINVKCFRERFTSLSFVTKDNQDNELQIADLSTYFLRKKCEDLYLRSQVRTQTNEWAKLFEDNNKISNREISIYMQIPHKGAFVRA
jgi:hypothetical protein